MTRDKWIIYTASGILLPVLFATLFLKQHIAMLSVAALLAVAAIAASVLLPKRAVPSLYARAVTGLMLLIAPVCLTVYYLAGIWTGFHPARVPLSFTTFFLRVVPITVAVIAGECLRRVLLAQKGRCSRVLSYLVGVLAEVSLLAGFSTVYHFNSFMDAVGLVLFPACVSHLLYQYLSARYGVWSCAAYRLVMLLYPFFIPYVPSVPDALVAFAKMLLPLAIYVFIDSLYEKKQKRAPKRSAKWTWGLAALPILLAAALLALVSGQFRHSVLVIATGSMTGELNRGDVAFYERYEDQTLSGEQIIVFERNDVKVVHRIVDVEHINGETRYTTKGDANDDPDEGYVTAADIVGVVEAKMPYVGYPTLWLHELVTLGLRGE